MRESNNCQQCSENKTKAITSKKQTQTIEKQNMTKKIPSSLLPTACVLSLGRLPNQLWWLRDGCQGLVSSRR
jgi:hypothetical protein